MDNRLPDNEPFNGLGANVNVNKSVNIFGVLYSHIIRMYKKLRGKLNVS
jgi:hypothetical protein